MRSRFMAMLMPFMRSGRSKRIVRMPSSESSVVKPEQVPVSMRAPPKATPISLGGAGDLCQRSGRRPLRMQAKRCFRPRCAPVQHHLNRHAVLICARVECRRQLHRSGSLMARDLSHRPSRGSCDRPGDDSSARRLPRRALDAIFSTSGENLRVPSTRRTQRVTEALGELKVRP